MCSVLCSRSGLRPRQAAQQSTSLQSTGAVALQVGIQFVSPVHEFPEDKWDAIIDVCLNSAFHATKAALPYMMEQQWGRSGMQQQVSAASSQLHCDRQPAVWTCPQLSCAVCKCQALQNHRHVPGSVVAHFAVSLRIPPSLFLTGKHVY